MLCVVWDALCRFFLGGGKTIFDDVLKTHDQRIL
jgi:hypothetical protein